MKWKGESWNGKEWNCDCGFKTLNNFRILAHVYPCFLKNMFINQDRNIRDNKRSIKLSLDKVKEINVCKKCGGTGLINYRITGSKSGLAENCSECNIIV